MEIKSKISYWIQTAESDLVTAEKLFQSGEYHWALFFYKVATKEFAYENLELIKQELQWI